MPGTLGNTSLFVEMTMMTMLVASLLATASSMSAGTFTDLGLSHQLVRAAATQNWQSPTHVQQHAIPAILQGDDVWAEAPTGSGKTAAFALPLLQRLLDGGPQRRGRNGIRTLILSPTRELAVQTASTFRALFPDDERGPKVLALHGGVSINPQLRSLGGGADVLVATPGRLLDVLDNNGASVEDVSILVLDEADRLLATEFAFELESILERLPPAAARQTLLFSATFPYKSRPKARQLLSPSHVRLTSEGHAAAEEGGDIDGEATPRSARPSTSARYSSSAPPATIHQRAIVVDLRERTPLLRHLLEVEGWARVLVFVRSQKSAEHVAMKLTKGGYGASTLHGALSQEVRASRLDDLRSSRLRVLVATDLAARGLDVAGLEAIVNYELPRSTADYTHRVGRTGRAGEAGVAVSFVASTGSGNEAHFALIERRHGGMAVPREMMEGFIPKDVERVFGGDDANGAADGGAAAAGGATTDELEHLPAVPGVRHSSMGLAHDRMHGGVKGRRMSKKDKLRAAAAKAGRSGGAVMSAVDDSTLVRLDKLLAERGAGSRKDVDRMIRNGLVVVDGETVPKNGAKLKIAWASCPIVDGFDYPPPPLLAVYHKPLGVVSSMKDDHGRPDLASVLPVSWQKVLHPVGRLDADTTGLLLFSRDGDLTHRLLHPKYTVEREYVAEVENTIDATDLGEKLAAGVETIEDGEPLVVPATLLGVDAQSVRLVVTEGKYRMVRRILANCGHPVVALHRVRYGEVRLDHYPIGEGDAAPIEGDALEWAEGLLHARSDVGATD